MLSQCFARHTHALPALYMRQVLPDTQLFDIPSMSGKRSGTILQWTLVLKHMTIMPLITGKHVSFLLCFSIGAAWQYSSSGFAGWIHHLPIILGGSSQWWSVLCASTQQISASSENLAAYGGSCRGGQQSCIRLLQASSNSSGCAWQLQRSQLRLFCSKTLLEKMYCTDSIMHGHAGKYVSVQVTWLVVRSCLL